MEVSYEEFCRAMAGKTVQQRIGYRLYKETKMKLEAAEQTIRRLCENITRMTDQRHNLEDMVIRAASGEEFTDAQKASPDRTSQAVVIVQDLLGDYLQSQRELEEAAVEIARLKQIISKRKK